MKRAVIESNPDIATAIRLVINLLHPRVIQAYENAEAWSQAQQTLTAQNETLKFLRRALIECDDSGVIHSATPLGSEWLTQYFHLSTPVARRLPEELTGWVKTHTPVASSLYDAPSLNSQYVITRADKRLTIRCLRMAANLLLLLEERSAGVSVEALRSLGLTNRQTEILSWIAQGETNPEIGLILGVSPRTVQKHIEHLYQRLGIETRAAAVAIVMQCCQQTDIGS